MKPIAASLHLQQSLTLPNTEEARAHLTANLAGDPRQGGRPIARRQSLDNGAPELQALQRQITALEAQVAKAQSKDDIDLAPGDFSAELHRHLLGQRRYEQKATADYFGTQGWAHMRRNQLGRIPGGEVFSAQYGASFAKEVDPVKPGFARLDINHPTNSKYRRLDSDANALGLCEQMFQRRFPQEPPAHHLFVNSEHMAEKMVNRSRAMRFQEGDVKMLPVAPGIIAVTCADEGDKVALEELADAFGGRISNYQAIRASVEMSGRARLPVVDPQVNVAGLVGKLSGANEQSVAAQLRSVPDELGTAALAHTAAALIDELAKLLSMPMIAERHQHNPLVACGLQGLHFIAESLPALALDSTRFGNAYRVMMEELHVVLAAVRPYNLQSFKVAASGRIRGGLDPVLTKKMIKPEPFLTTSGMHAMTQSLDLARFLGRGGLAPLTHGDKSTPFFYEGQFYVDKFKKAAGEDARKPKAFYTTLGDSYVYAPALKQANWNLDDVLKGIKAQLAEHPPAGEPLNVVLDTTVEREHDLSTLLKALAPDLANNQLRLFLCKSHQKYANLGSAKVMGGSLTLLGADSVANRQLQGRLRDDETAQGWFDNDESQLLTHLTRVAQKQEPKLLQTSIENARFVAEQCFHGRDGHAQFAGHDPEAPFAMIPLHADSPPAKWPGFQVESKEGVERVPLPPAAMLNTDFMRNRGSFGFTESNMGNIGHLAGYNDAMLRLSFGQENKAELIERFWMPGRQMHLGKPLLDCRQANFEVIKLVYDALGPEHREQFKGQPLSAKLKFIGQQEAATLNEQQRNQAGVAELRATLATPQGFTLNKVASVVAHLNYLLVRFNMAGPVAKSADALLLHDLLGNFVASGMPGVSRMAREQAVSLQCVLSHEAMKTDEPEKRRAGVDNLLGVLKHSDVGQSRGLFNHAIPDVAYEECSTAVREKLVDRVFGVLDTPSKLEFLHTQMASREGLKFVEDCARQLAGQLTGTSPADTEQHWRATVMQQMINRGIIRPAPRGQV